MKINYKIVWLDDQPKSMKNHIDEIKSILEENYFIPEIGEAYLSYENFQNSFNTLSTNDYGEVFNDCDLLLIDYHIAESRENKEKTGATLIKQLREKNIYTEAVFYSNAMEDYRKRTDKEELDNVIYADKSELVNKVEHIIKKAVVRSMIISNLRGYLMDSTSDFDFICKVVSENYFMKLNEEQQFEILRFAEEYIHNQYKSEIDKFEKINEKYKKITDFNKITIDYKFIEITDENKRISTLKRIFNSIESVIPVRDKFRLMSLIIQKNNFQEFKEIFSIDIDNKNNDIYNENIIKHRNKLAHSKLIYGKKCKSRLKIINTLDELACNCNSLDCEKSYSYEECLKLRENIYKYYILFNKLLNYVINE
jgi:hypothetical protein